MNTTVPDKLRSSVERQLDQLPQIGFGLATTTASGLIELSNEQRFALAALGCVVMLYGAWRRGWLPLPTGKSRITEAAMTLYNFGGPRIRRSAQMFAEVLHEHYSRGDGVKAYGRDQALEAAKRELITLYGRRGAGLSMEKISPTEIRSARISDDGAIYANIGSHAQLFEDVRVPRWQVGRLRRAIIEGKLLVPIAG